MLTAEQAARTTGFDRATINALGSSTGASETLSAAAAVSLDVYETRLVVSGTMAFTLPDAAVAGHRKRIVCESAASSPAGTLTITSPDTTTGHVCASTFFFDSPGQAIELIWTGSKWRVERIKRAGNSGANGVVVGTTVLTGKNLWATYELSVTNTVASSVASGKGIPDGSTPGEMILVTCTTAGGTPVGTIELAGLVVATGATGTKTLGTFNATTVWASLVWTGTYWQLLGAVTANIT